MTRLESPLIRRAVTRDAAAIAEICNHYVDVDHRVLREEPVEIAEMRERIGAGPEPGLAFVLEQGGAVIGYSYATAWSGPKAHPATLETTIYLAATACGRGFGRALYSTQLRALEERNVHTAIACIALPNEASIALHAGLGFTKLAHLAQAVEKHGRSFDLEYWARRLT